MPPYDLWLLTVPLWLSLPWLITYLSNGLTSVTRLAIPKLWSPKPLTPRSEDDCLDCQADQALSVPLIIILYNKTQRLARRLRLCLSWTVAMAGHSTAKSALHTPLALSPINKCSAEVRSPSWWQFVALRNVRTPIILTE